MNYNEILKAVSYPVALRPVVVDMGEGVTQPLHNRRAVIANGEPVSFVSSKYQLVENKELFEPVLEVLKRTGWQPAPERSRGRFSSPVVIDSAGRHVSAEFVFPDLKSDLPGIMDQISPRILVTNSYDATRAMSVRWSFYQWRCTNVGALVRGDVSAGGMSDFVRRHHGLYNGIDTDMVRANVERAVDLFPELIGSFRSLLNQSVTDYEAERFFAKHVGQRWAKKKPLSEDNKSSAWELYARVTNFITMDFKGGRLEAERRTQAAMRELMAMVDASVEAGVH